MKTPAAFFLRFLLPPLYATPGFALIALVENPASIKNLPAHLGIVALYAYVFAGLPALLFALLLGRFARRRPAFRGRLARATLLGLAAGLLITAMFGFESAVFFAPIGALVGAAVEAAVIAVEKRARPALVA